MSDSNPVITRSPTSPAKRTKPRLGFIRSSRSKVGKDGRNRVPEPRFSRPWCEVSGKGVVTKNTLKEMNGTWTDASTSEEGTRVEGDADRLRPPAEGEALRNSRTFGGTLINFV